MVIFFRTIVIPKDVFFVIDEIRKKFLRDGILHKELSVTASASDCSICVLSNSHI